MRTDTRKVYRSGKSSYIVTLPKEWVEKFGIKDGDFIFLEIKNNSIVIRPNTSESRTTAVIDYPEASFDNLVRLVISYYLAGVTSLRIKVYNDEQRRAVAYAAEMLMGSEIMEDTGNEMVIEVFIEISRFDLRTLIERTFNMILSMLKDLQKALENFDRTICSSIMVREDEIDKLYFLMVRLLKFMGSRGIIEPVDGIEYTTVVRNLERISDHINRISESLINLGEPYLELKSKIETIEKLIRKTMVTFFKEDRELAREVLGEIEEFIQSEMRYYEKILGMDSFTIMNLKTILDSIVRVANYAANIAETSFDMSLRKEIGG